MLVAVSSMGTDLDAWAGNPFGTCPQFLVVDSETMEYVVVSVPAEYQDPSLASGHAIRSIARQGAELVITGPVKDICREIMQSLGMKVISNVPPMTVRNAVLRYAVGLGAEPISDAPPAEKIAVSTPGTDLDASLAASTETCTSFLLVDTSTMQSHRIDVEPAVSSQDASLHALRAAVRAGATVVITTHMSSVCCVAARALAIAVVLAPENYSARQAIESYLAGQLPASQSL